MFTRSLIGWVVAGVLAVALGGVLIYEAVGGGGGGDRTAAFSGKQGNGPPPELVNDVNAILDAKNNAGPKDRPPNIPPGKSARQLDENPQQRCDPALEPNVIAEWRNSPNNLNQAAAMADQVIVGTAENVEQSTPFTANVAGEPGGAVETPVQNITIHVDQSVKGGARAGGVVTIQRLGDAAGCFRVQGDPPYQRGEQYLLMLEDGQGGRPPHPIAPEGRYRVRENGALEAVTKNPVAEEIAGQRLEQVLQRVR